MGQDENICRAPAESGADFPEAGGPDFSVGMLLSDNVAGILLVTVQAAQIGRRGSEYARKTRLLGDFLPAPPHRIEDPWGRTDEVYALTFERIVSAVEQLSRVLEPGNR